MGLLGYYINCDDALCAECFTTEYGDDDNGAEDSAGFTAWRERGGFESWSEPAAIMDGEESDSPVHCKKCEELIKVNMTPDGLTYVGEHLADGMRCDGDGGRKCITRQWWEAYGDDFDEHDLRDIISAVVQMWPTSDEFSPK
ncbi:MAG TPA: hypothetical protein VG476_02485 [Acidimicrobiales bacterium]|nr:hypothetical protein [Acidimicrobiales bacterium]